MISQHWQGIGSQNPAPWKKGARLVCKVYTMATDVPATQGAEISVAMVMN